VKLFNKVYKIFIAIGFAILIIIFINKKNAIVRRVTNILVEYKIISPKLDVWGSSFKIVDIKSELDGNKQKAYFYQSTLKKASPLIISLHPWRGSYSQFDSLSILCKKLNINYIHPDFRGPNNNLKACCSDLALNDIEESITYAVRHANVDTSKIYLIGGSGGGHATLMMYMKSNSKIKKYSSWAAVSDLYQWYEECKISGNKKALSEILACTNSTENNINHLLFKEKSPIYYNTPANKQQTSELTIYAGIFDGVASGLQITHSINFYNKLLSDLNISDSSKYISNKEKLFLLEKRKPFKDFGKIGNRNIILQKEIQNIKIIIFEGGHEILYEHAIADLLK